MKVNLLSKIAYTCTFSFLSLGTLSSAQASSFEGIGDIPGDDFFSRANGVSADGSVVVGQTISGSGFEAFRWSETIDGKIQGLGFLPGGLDLGLSEANGVSADGSVIVGRSSSSIGQEAFRWTEATGMLGLGVLPGGAFFSEANGVSADGSIIVGSSTSSTGTQAYRWNDLEGMVGLGLLPGVPVGPLGGVSVALGVSADGSTIVGASSSVKNGVSDDVLEAFRWTEGEGMVGLDFLSDLGDFSDSAARGVSADGSVIVGSSSNNSGSPEAFRWTEATGMVGLGDLPGGGFSSGASAVSPDGSIIVGSGFTDNDLEAFIWDEVNGMRNLQDVLENDFGLDLMGWLKLTEATGISMTSDMLTIVGYGRPPQTIGDDITEGWIARINLSSSRVPEPSTILSLLTISGIALGASKKKQG